MKKIKAVSKPSKEQTKVRLKKHARAKFDKQVKSV